MYNKLFTKILDSSIWMEDISTRIVWITFIAAMNQDGFVEFASVANVAHRAVVKIADAKRAIAILEGEDANSSDPANGGRRIERVSGGWMVLNAEKYRDLVTKAVQRERTRERVRAHRERKRTGNGRVAPSDTDTDADSEGEGSVTDYAPSPSLTDKIDSKAPTLPNPEKIPTAAFQRIRASREIDVRQAIFAASLDALVQAMGARGERGQEWHTACNGQNLPSVLAVFDWRMTTGTAIREPSHYVEALRDWRELSQEARQAIGRAAVESYGIPWPKPAAAPEAAPAGQP